jgi:hypothetical protein
VQPDPGRARPDAQRGGRVRDRQPVDRDQFEHGPLVRREPGQGQAGGPAGALGVDALLQPGDVVVIQEPAAGGPAGRAQFSCGAAALPGDDVARDPVQPGQLRAPAGR